MPIYVCWIVRVIFPFWEKSVPPLNHCWGLGLIFEILRWWNFDHGGLSHKWSQSVWLLPDVSTKYMFRRNPETQTNGAIAQSLFPAVARSREYLLICDLRRQKYGFSIVHRFFFRSGERKQFFVRCCCSDTASNFWSIIFVQSVFPRFNSQQTSVVDTENRPLAVKFVRTTFSLQLWPQKFLRGTTTRQDKRIVDDISWTWSWS